MSELLTILQFIFSSFWVFWGTLMLIATVGAALNLTFAGIRGKLLSK